MNITLTTKAGEKGKAVALPKEIFEAKADPRLLAQAVRVYLGNQRKAAAVVKTRGEVAKTTAKMFKQKGTGNARHGSYSAPIFVGGGVAHGPDGRQNWRRTLTKAMTKKALTGAMTNRAEEKKVWVVEGGEWENGKTREAAGWRKQVVPEMKKLLVVVAPGQTGVKRAFNNLLGVEVVETARLNPYVVLAYPGMVVTTEAIEQLAKTYSQKTK